MGYAIRAAAVEDPEEGFAIFGEWCERWDGEGNDIETVRADWDRMHPPFAIGWDWIAGLARGHGYCDAPDVFPVVDTAPERQRIRYSDRWLADETIALTTAKVVARPLVASLPREAGLSGFTCCRLQFPV